MQAFARQIPATELALQAAVQRLVVRGQVRLQVDLGRGRFFAGTRGAGSRSGSASSSMPSSNARHARGSLGNEENSPENRSGALRRIAGVDVLGVMVVFAERPARPPAGIAGGGQGRA